MDMRRRLQEALSRLRETREARAERWEEQRRAAYHAHLNSPYWADLRARALRRAGHQCEWVTRTGKRCETTHHLEVHHLHYDTFGREHLRDVQVLCVRHHQIADGRRRKEIAQRLARQRKRGRT